MLFHRCISEFITDLLLLFFLLFLCFLLNLAVSFGIVFLFGFVLLQKVLKRCRSIKILQKMILFLLTFRYCRLIGLAWHYCFLHNSLWISTHLVTRIQEFFQWQTYKKVGKILKNLNFENCEYNFNFSVLWRCRPLGSSYIFLALTGFESSLTIKICRLSDSMSSFG